MRFVVISENTSDQETYVDYVEAGSREKALALVADLRGDATDGHLAATTDSVFAADDLRDLVVNLEFMPREEILHWFDDLKKEIGR